MRKIPCVILLHIIRSCVVVLKSLVTTSFYFNPTHVLSGVYFPGIIISRSKLHMEHHLLFKVKTITGMTRKHRLAFFHEKWNTFQRLYEKSNIQQIAEEDIHLRRCQRAAHRQGSACYYSLALCYCFVKACWTEN